MVIRKLFYEEISKRIWKIDYFLHWYFDEKSWFVVFWHVVKRKKYSNLLCKNFSFWSVFFHMDVSRKNMRIITQVFLHCVEKPLCLHFSSFYNCWFIIASSLYTYLTYKYFFLEIMYYFTMTKYWIFFLSNTFSQNCISYCKNIYIHH